MKVYIKTDSSSDDDDDDDASFLLGQLSLFRLSQDLLFLFVSLIECYREGRRKQVMILKSCSRRHPLLHGEILGCIAEARHVNF
jgi:hypothetical protein